MAMMIMIMTRVPVSSTSPMKHVGSEDQARDLRTMRPTRCQLRYTHVLLKVVLHAPHDADGRRTYGDVTPTTSSCATTVDLRKAHARMLAFALSACSGLRRVDVSR